METINVSGIKVTSEDLNKIFTNNPSLSQYFKSIIEETLKTKNNGEIIGVVIAGKEYMIRPDKSFSDIYYTLMNEASQLLSIDMMIKKITGTIRKTKDEFVLSAKNTDYREINGGWLYMRSSNKDKCDMLKKLCDYTGLDFEIVYS
jgi:predicted nucleotide-binding protein (sugar kinase/HSP70/actin superfamily)